MTQSQVRAKIVEQLYQDRGSPWNNFPNNLYAADAQGWNSGHSYLPDTIDVARPSVIVEVGVWKGGSTIAMAKHLKETNIDAVIISVDTWLGSWEHWHNPRWFSDLRLQNGYPGLFYTFMSNCIHEGVEDYVVPLPIDSTSASTLIKRYAIKADIVHIDGAHDYESVLNDLQRWFDILRPGGYVICDDYDASGVRWPTVKSAVDDFVRDHPCDNFEAKPMKCRFRKQ